VRLIPEKGMLVCMIPAPYANKKVQV